jgi:hypothetical protein
MKPTRMSRWIKRFARDASAVVLPEPKKPPAKISFTGFLTESVLLGLILSPPVPGSVYRKYSGFRMGSRRQDVCLVFKPI